MAKPPQPIPGGRAEKTMSSRLLTMKFMQRAAASSPDQSSNPASWTSPSSLESPTKRQKVSSSPSTSATLLSDHQAMQTALDAEDAKRSKALERVAAERGETKWTLSYVDEEERGRRTGFRVAQASYVEIDSDDRLKPDGKGRWALVGRRSFGNFNKDLEKQQNSSTTDPPFLSSNEASEAEDIDSQESDDASGTKYLIRESKQAAMSSSKDKHRASKMAAKAQVGQRAEMPLNSEINLNRLSSISGTSGIGGKKSADKNRGGQANIECYNCGGKGHISLDCPNPGRKRRFEYDGAAPNKRSKKVETLDY